MTDLICPTCGGVAVSKKTTYGVRNSCCDLWSWGDKPLVDRATHEARRAAHASFDPLWQTGMVSRSEAYAALSETLGIDKTACHIAQMSLEDAARVPGAVTSIKAALEARHG